MSSIDPIGYPSVPPAERLTGITRKARREEDEAEERGRSEDDAPEDEQPPPDDRPAPQHVDLRG